MVGDFLGLSEQDWEEMLVYPMPKLLRCCPMMEELRSQVRLIYTLGVGQYSAELLLAAYTKVCEYHDMKYSEPLTHLVHHLRYSVLGEKETVPAFSYMPEIWHG